MQDILVRAERIDAWDRGVQVAARIAAKFGGSLTAVHAVPIGLPPLMPYDPGMVAAAAALEVSRQTAEAQARAPEFTSWASSMGVKHPAWLATAGDAASALQYVAGWHDLVVATLEPDGSDPWAQVAGVGKIVLSTGLPTLVIPSGCPDETAYETVVVGWDGSPAAIRALHGAAAFIERAARVVIWRGADPGREPLTTEKFLDCWLTRHRRDAEIRTLVDSQEGGAGTGALLLAAARQEHADMLVIGAYGHSRFSEWVLGGVTRHVLENADRPLLLRH